MGRDHPGDLIIKSIFGRKGDPMVKTLRSKTGMVKHAALVVGGWLSFVAGQVVVDLPLKCILLAIARVLPYRFLSTGT